MGIFSAHCFVEHHCELWCCGHAWLGVQVTAAQPGTRFGAGAFWCWVFFAEVALKSNCRELEPAGRVNTLRGLPGWEKGISGGEMGEGAGFWSWRFPAARCSAAGTGVWHCWRSWQLDNRSSGFPKHRCWHLPFCSCTSWQRCCSSSVTEEGEIWPSGFSSSHFPQQPGLHICKQL